MAYCNIENKFIGKKLDSMFGASNRNKMASLFDEKEFKEWFGNGRIDAEGNPVIDELFSFTNEKGEKKTIFDIPSIVFNSSAEIKKLLSSSPAIYKWRDALFIKNTEKDSNGKPLGQRAKKLVEIVNFYYPGALSIVSYKRNPTSKFSKDASIPVPVIHISDDITWNKRPSLFSYYDNPPVVSTKSEAFNQIDSVEFTNFIESIEKHSVNEKSDIPAVSEDVFQSLVKFLEKINPNFQIEEFNKLPVNAISYIKDFLIYLKSDKKYEAMPEEAAHFFVELLPKDSSLRKDLLSNITNYDIYYRTLSAYKHLKEYQNENGSVNYDKIKREAAAKLIAEYVFVLSGGSSERLEQLTKVKQNWITSWWKAFIKWLKSFKDAEEIDSEASYKEAARKILEGDISDLSIEEASQRFENATFFSVSEMDKMRMAQRIRAKVVPAGKVEQLQNVIEDFRKELRSSFEKITNANILSKLRDSLKTNPEDKYLPIYEIYDMIKKANINVSTVEDSLSIDSQLINLTEFISAIAAMEKIAKKMDLVTDEYLRNTDAVQSIKELEAIRSTYDGFKILVDSKLMRVLTESQVENDVRKAVADTASIFAAIDDKIINILRTKIGDLFNQTLGKQNAYVIEENMKVLNKLLSEQFKDPESQAKIVSAINQYTKDLNNLKKIKAKEKLIRNLQELKVPSKMLASWPVSNIFERIESMYFSPQFIEDMLKGEGKDIDQISNMSHFVTAGIKNHDAIISNVAKFVTDRKSKNQNLARIAIGNYEDKIGSILKSLKSSSIDEYKAGEMITDIDSVVDTTVDKDGNPNYEEGKRSVVYFLKPWENFLSIRKNELNEEKVKALKKWESEKTPENRKAYIEARNKWQEWLNKYFNSPYKKEFRDFQEKWSKNELFNEIIEEWRNLNTEERSVEDLINAGENTEVNMERRRYLRSEKTKLLTEERKTGDELEKTKLLKQYFEESSKFRTVDENRTRRNYEAAKSLYMSKIDQALVDSISNVPEDQRTIQRVEQNLRKYLRNPNFSIVSEYLFRVRTGPNKLDKEGFIGDEELYIIREMLQLKWEQRNTVKVRTETFKTVSDRIITEIKKLKEEKSISRLDEAITLLTEKMYSILYNKNDGFGQKDPSLLTEEEKETVLEIENTINLLKEASGFKFFKILDSVKQNATQEDSRIIQIYEERIDEYIKNILNPTFNATTDYINQTKDEIKTMTEFLIQRGIITGEQVIKNDDIRKELKFLWALYGQLSDFVPSQHYIDGIERLIDSLQSYTEKLQSELNTSNIEPSKVSLMEAEIRTVNKLLNGDIDINGNKPASFLGLKGALYNADWEQLEAILNDQQLMDGEIVQFKRFVSETSVFRQLYPEVVEWFQNAHVQKLVFLKDKFQDPETKEIHINEKKLIPVEREYTIAAYYKYSEPMLESLDNISGISIDTIKKDLKGPLFIEKKPRRFEVTKIDEQWFEEQITWENSSDPEDWTVDNKSDRPEYLPLSRKQRRERGITDESYLSKKYYDLMDAKDSTSKILQDYYNISLMTYLKEQSNKPDNIKGFMKLPVTRLDSYQKLKADVVNFKDRMKHLGQEIKVLFGGKSSAVESDQMIEGILQMRDYDEATQQVIYKDSPMLGMNAKLPVERVNRNVNHAITMYIFNSKDFEARVDVQPILKAIIDVMKENESSQYMFQKNRRSIIEKIYNQHVLNKVPDSIDNYPWIRNVSSRLMSLTAMKIMFDTAGGAINYIQAHINNTIEAFSYKYVTPKNYAQGTWLASQMMKDLLLDYNKKSDFSFFSLLYQAFDFIQGDVVDDLSERTATKNKIFDFGRLAMFPRKVGELHAQSSMALAIMDNIKVLNQNDNKEYPMWQIYKKENGVLVLKDGFYEIDPVTKEKTYPYNPIDGKKFLDVRERIHSINLDLHGNYAKLNQTEASRYSIGKLMENMKRWFVSGFQRRFGRYSYDVNTQDNEYGYYRSSLKALFRLLKDIITLNLEAAKMDSKYTFTDPMFKQNIRRMSAEVAIALTLFGIGFFGFGYDDDDPEKNKKLEANSYIKNFLLLVTLRTYAEHTAYIPVPGFGFSEMARNLLDPFSVAKSTMLNTAALARITMLHIGYLLGLENEDKVFYERDGGGILNEKGDSKWVNYFMKTFGYNGSQFDPGYYIRNYQAMQNRLK